MDQAFDFLPPLAFSPPKTRKKTAENRFVYTKCRLTPQKHHFDELNNMVAQKSREKQKRGIQT